MGALRSTQGKKRLNELVEQDFTSQMTETRSRELGKAFKFIDSDHSGVRLLGSGFLLACLLACLLTASNLCKTCIWNPAMQCTDE
jgi:hypothetical protein